MHVFYFSHHSLFCEGPEGESGLYLGVPGKTNPKGIQPPYLRSSPCKVFFLQLSKKRILVGISPSEKNI